jgi:hypothetical protein
MDAHGLPDDELPDAISLELRELWEKERDTARDVGFSEERTGSAVGVDTVQIIEAIADESRTLFMILPLFF